MGTRLVGIESVLQAIAGHCRKLPRGVDIDDWWNFSWRLHSNNKPLDYVWGF